MASREKKQIASKQFTSKKECPPSDKSTETTGGKTATSEKKKETRKKSSDQKQHTVKKNSRSAKSSHVELTNSNKIEKNLSLPEKNVQSSSVAKCKPDAKKQTGSAAKQKQYTKEPSESTSLNAKSCMISTKKCKSNVNTKCKVMGNLKSKTSMENITDQDSKDLLGLDETSFVNQLFATSVSQRRNQNTKLKKKYKKQISASGLEVCNGTRSRSTPYLTRSDSPIRVLRNGKRRKLKDPGMLDGLDSIEHAKKRRRVASVTKEGTIEGDSSIYEFSRAQVESDNSNLNPRSVCDELMSAKNEEGCTCKDQCNFKCERDMPVCETPNDSMCVLNKINGQCVRRPSTQELHRSEVSENSLSRHIHGTKCNVEVNAVCCENCNMNDTKISDFQSSNVSMQNGKINGHCISEASLQELCENKVTEKRLPLDVQSTNCRVEATVAENAVICDSRDMKKETNTSGEYNLGKTISNRIAELIKRSKISEARRSSGSDEEGCLLKQDMQSCDSVTVLDSSLKQIDSNTNPCDLGEIKQCVPASGVGVSLACFKDNVASSSNSGAPVSKQGGNSNQSYDAADNKVGQLSSDGVSNIGEGGNRLELNFSEVRAAISKKIQKCAKESSFSSSKYKENVTLQDGKSNIHNEVLVHSNKINTNISSELTGSLSNTSEIPKNSTSCRESAVKKSTHFSQRKVKSCKRVLEPNADSPSSCLKKAKIHKRLSHNVKKLQTPLNNKFRVGSNKKSGFTKIISHHKIASIAIGDLTISAIGPELSYESGLDENYKHCTLLKHGNAKNPMGRCPCPDNCNNHLNYSCDVLKSTGVNGKITDEPETLQSGRAEILKMMDVFEFRDESDEVSNRGKLLNPTLLTDCENTNICETNMIAAQKSCFSEDVKCARAADCSSNAAVNVQILHCIAAKCSTECNDMRQHSGDHVSTADGQSPPSSSNAVETLEAAVPDLSVVATLDELLTLASELNLSPTERGDLKSNVDVVGDSQMPAQNLGERPSREVKYLLEETDKVDSLIADKCDTDTFQSKSNDELVLNATCVDAVSQDNGHEHGLGSVSRPGSGSCSLETSAKPIVAVVTVVESPVSERHQVTECDTRNGADTKNTTNEKTKSVNHLCTEIVCNSDEKMLNQFIEVLHPNENDKSSDTVTTAVKDDKRECDQTMKYKCTNDKIVVACADDKITTAPIFANSIEDSEIVLRDLLNDMLEQVNLSVEAVFEGTSQSQDTIGRIVTSTGEMILQDDVKTRNMLEDLIQVDNSEDPVKTEEYQGKSFCEIRELDPLCTENVTIGTCVESGIEELPELKEENKAVDDAGCNLNVAEKLDDEPGHLPWLGDVKLCTGIVDEFQKLAVTCRESDDGGEDGAVPEPEAEAAVLSAKGLEGELEDVGESERKQIEYGALCEPAHVSVTETLKDACVGCMERNNGTAPDNSEVLLELSGKDVSNREGEGVETKKETANHSDLMESREIFPEYKETEKLEEVKDDASILEHYLDGSLTECSKGEEVCGPADEKHFEEDESPEAQAVKESILSALGLQSLRAARAAAATALEVSSYTGTLKTVIKVSRSPDKKNARLPLRAKKTRGADGAGSIADDVVDEHEADDLNGTERIKYSICSESMPVDISKSASSPEQILRKSVKSSICHRSQNDTGAQTPGEKDSAPIKNQDDDGKQSGKQDSNLIIPEKSSSFSIHPQRLCSDVCSYCFGKFGCLDTPCHIAQLKSIERQKNILCIETHLTADSCLCDACYRHVDRKANCPSYKPNRKRQYRSDDTHPKSLCCVQGCSLPAYHTVRRKWLLKLKRSIAKKVPIDMEKIPQHLPFPLCSQHYYWVDFFMVCGVCKRKLTRNHMYPLGSEVNDLNKYLIGDGIPVNLTDKIYLCKLCRYFCTLRLKHKDPSQLTGNHKMFFDSYKKRILHYNDIEVMDSDEVAEPIVMPPKSKRRKTKDKEGRAAAEHASKTKNSDARTQPNATKIDSLSVTLDQQQNEPQVEFINLADGVGDTNRSGASTPLIDYSTLDTSAGTTTINIVSYGAETAGKSGKQRTGHASGNSVGNRPFYPASEELPLHANFDFHSKPRSERDPKPNEWDKCTATIQFDKQTKKLFQQLQRPYGNHSSFFRHLILLEKYWRSGDLVLSPNASQRAVNYVTSVNCRISSFEGHTVPLFPVPPATSVISSNPSVPIIDLPLRGRVSTSGLGSPPVVVTSQSMTVTAVSSVSTATASTSSISCTPIFSSGPFVSSPSSMPLFSSPTSGGYMHGRRMPNVLQVTAGGKSFSIVPNMIQLQKLQTLQLKQQLLKQHRDRQVSGFVPLITDVRSLATDTWEQKNLTKVNPTNTSTQSRQSKMSVTILPKPSPKVAIPALRPGVKPSTVVTPTGIILSKTPELSVIAMPVETTVPGLPAVGSDTPGS